MSEFMNLGEKFFGTNVEANKAPINLFACSYACTSQETSAETISYNPFDIYQQLRKELYGEEIGDFKEAEFNKILSGELETNDVLALSIIEAAKQDIYTDELSEEELLSFYDKLANNEIEGIDIDDLSDNDTGIEDLYEAQMNELTLKYLDKPAEDCTPEELNQTYALSLVDNILMSSEEGLKNQDDSDGAISEIFDWLKEKTGLGTCQEDVEAALEIQKGIVARLKAAIKNGNFEEVWQKETGIEYDPEKIALYQEKSSQLEFLSLSIQGFSTFQKSLMNDENMYNPEGIYNAYIEFFGKEKGEKAFLETLKYGFNNTPESPFHGSAYEVQNIYFDKNGEIILETADGSTLSYGKVKYLDSSFLTVTYSSKFMNLQMDAFIKELETTTGLNYTNLVEETNALSNEALGDANAVSNTLNKYINSQESFIDKFAGFTQIAGMGVMVAGYGIACFIPGGQAIGLGMAKIGQGMAIAGTFGDEALEVIDKATNNKTFEEDLEEYKEILKEFMVDGALFASGYAIGNFANGIGDMVLSSTGSRLLSKAADIGIDASLSLLSDLAITGEIDLTGEGISQFIGILTGSMLSRINAANTKIMDGATDILNTKGLDDAVSYLKTQGASNQTIKDFKINAEAQRLSGDINAGKISAEEAVQKLQELGISKKALVQFQKAHGLEYRTPAQIMRDLIKKNGIDSTYAKEATIDHKLNMTESIKYSKYRKSGMSSDMAMRNIEFDRLNIDDRIKNLEALGASPDSAKIYAQNMTFKEYDRIESFLKADTDGRVEILRKLGIDNEFSLPYYADQLNNYESISSFSKLLSFGFDAHDALYLIPNNAASKTIFDNSIKFSQMDNNAKIAELEKLGLSNSEAKEFARNFSPADYIKMNELVGRGVKPSDAAFYGKNIPAIMLVDLPEIIKTRKNVLDKLIDMGITNKALEGLATNQKLGELLQNVDADRLAALEKISKDSKALRALCEISSNTGNLSGIATANIAKYYDDFNYILYGDPVDLKLQDSLNEIGKKYGITLKAENCIGMNRNTYASYMVSEEYLKAIDSALTKMKDQGLKIPEEIYITGSLEKASGYFSPMNRNAISISTEMMSDPAWVEAVILHEASHMSDWNGSNYKSFNRAHAAGIVSTVTQKLDRDINFKGKTIKTEQIAGLIRDYATSNILEFKAEIGALLANGTITLENGKYTINKNNAPEYYCKSWTGSNDDHKALANIMELYNYLVK